MKMNSKRWGRAALGVVALAALLAEPASGRKIDVPGNSSCEYSIGGGVIVHQDCPSGWNCCNHPIYAPDGQLLYSYETCCEPGLSCHVWIWYEIGAQQIFCF